MLSQEDVAAINPGSLCPWWESVPLPMGCGSEGFPKFLLNPPLAEQSERVPDPAPVSSRLPVFLFVPSAFTHTCTEPHIALRLPTVGTHRGHFSR